MDFVRDSMAQEQQRGSSDASPPDARPAPRPSDEPLRHLAVRTPDSGQARTTQLAAIHLAGHAVAAEVCGLGYPPLRLESEPTACGFVPRRDGGGHGPARNGIEAAIITSLAGVEAERLAGAHPDSACLEVAAWLTDGEPRDAEPYIEWLRLKAERTVEHPLRQRLILALAAALLERGALSPSEIEVIALAETSAYMRGQ
jgi:hypothetical protein